MKPDSPDNPQVAPNDDAQKGRSASGLIHGVDRTGALVVSFCRACAEGTCERGKATPMYRCTVCNDTRLRELPNHPAEPGPRHEPCPRCYP